MINAEVIFDIYSGMVNQRIISAYQGEFSHHVVNMLLKHAKSELDRLAPDMRTTKRTYNVLVECLENILRHSYSVMQNKQGEGAEGIIMLEAGTGDFYINVGNLVPSGEVQSLRRKLDAINAMSNKALRQAHAEIMANGSISEKGGAGLGIIDIAMRSGNKLAYEFRPYNESSAFYVLRVNIKTE